MYPVTLLAFAAIATAILLVKVIPTIVGLFPDKDKLPEITKITLSFSDFMIERRYVLILTAVSIVVAYQILYKYFLPFKMFIDGLLLKIPVL